MTLRPRRGEEMALAEMMARIAEAGFDGVDIVYGDYPQAELLPLLGQHGLACTVTAFPDSVDALAPALDLAARSVRAISTSSALYTRSAWRRAPTTFALACDVRCGRHAGYHRNPPRLHHHRPALHAAVDGCGPGDEPLRRSVALRRRSRVQVADHATCTGADRSGVGSLGRFPRVGWRRANRFSCRSASSSTASGSTSSPRGGGTDLNPGAGEARVTRCSIFCVSSARVNTR